MDLKNTVKMGQDTVADALNMIRNAQVTRKKTIRVKIVSELLLKILKIMKSYGAIKNYKILKGRGVEINLGELIDCKAIKPRFNVKVSGIEKYMRRYLPARGMGVIIVSTNEGLLTHEEALEKGKGGSLIAYFY